jgi:hypothetical protein
MQHRDGMRPRTIDDNKYYQVIKDIDNAKRTFTLEEKKEIEKYENDLIKAIQHFDNKKKIQTPKSLILEKNKLNNNLNEKNEKTEKIKEHTNNINSDIPVYELQEYKRPEHYIIYSSKERDQQKIKDYEAKYPDKVFLSFHGDFMKLDVLESIISDFENCIGKGDKIPEETAKKIIEEKYSKYKSKSDLIIKHFNNRRSEIKKSLLRKFWKIQKSTDKYITNTFRRREKDKMKIRKNNQKKEESLEKVQLAQDSCKTNLLSICDSMIQKEELNKSLIMVDNMMFISKVNIIQKNNMSKEYIKQNGEIISFLKEKGISMNEVKINSKEEKEKLEDMKENNLDERGRVGTASTRGDNSKGDSDSKEDEPYIINNKNTSPDIIYPNVDLDFLNNSKEKNKKESNKYRIRIRFNRNKKLTVDRYIQKKDSMDPFDDSFNEKIVKYQNYEPNLVMNSINYNYFENLFNNYYQQKYKFLSFISDNDDENQSIFKNKKNNKRLINKKRAFNK